jgi:DNA-binding CsgD family transcriptional regulator
VVSTRPSFEEPARNQVSEIENRLRPIEAADSRLRAREEELHRSVGAVLRGTSVEVAGPRRSGRTTLADEAARTLAGLGRDVLRIRADAELPDLEAVRLSLPPRVLAGIEGSPEPWTWLRRALAALADEVSVVIVDDLDLLDQMSRALLGLLHDRRGVPVLGAVCPGRSPRGRAGWLTDRCQPVIRVSLGPLTLEDLHVVLAARLDGELSPAVSARIHADAAGLPGTAVDVLEASIACGALERVGGLWVDGGGSAPAVAAAFDVHLADLPPSARRAVDVLAHAGSLTTSGAERLLQEGALDDLEARGMVRTVRGRDADRLLLHPPGLAEHVASTVPEPRRNRIAALAGRAPRPGRADGWLPRALARGHREHLTAAVHCWSENPTVTQAARVLRLALSGPCDPRVVADVLGGTDPRAGAGTFDDVALAYYRARWALAAGEAGAPVIEALERALPADDPRSGAVSSLALLLRSEVDRVDPGLGDVLRGRIRGDDDGSRTARVALAAWCVLRGEHADALATLSAGQDRWPELLRGSADLVRGLALFGTGEFARGLGHARTMLGRAAGEGDGGSYGAGSVIAGLCHGAMLDFEAVRTQLLELLASRAAVHALVLPVDRVARVLLASAELYAERTGLGPGLIALIERTPCGGALPLGDDGWSRALAEYAAGRFDAAARVLDGVVADRRSRGHVFAAEVTEMKRLMIWYDPARSAAFAPTAERIGGPLFAAYLKAKQAMHEEDPTMLMTLGDRLSRLAAVRGAARCYTGAASLFEHVGSLDEASLARDAAQVLAPGAPSRSILPSRLSVREREIVDLVAEGLPNPTIAEQLYLSRRTVESHLRNIKRKTGAVDRAAIARLAVR